MTRFGCLLLVASLLLGLTFPSHRINAEEAPPGKVKIQSIIQEPAPTDKHLFPEASDPKLAILPPTECDLNPLTQKGIYVPCNRKSETLEGTLDSTKYFNRGAVTTALICPKLKPGKTIEMESGPKNKPAEESIPTCVPEKLHVQHCRECSEKIPPCTTIIVDPPFDKICHDKCKPPQCLGMRSNPGPADMAIDVWNKCYYVDNSDKEGRSFFIPASTKKEWDAFITNHPSDSLTLIPCSRPSSVDITPNLDATESSETSCENPNGTPNTSKMPMLIQNYSRTGSTATTTPDIRFNCTVKGLCNNETPPQCGADQTWVKTVSSVSLAALDSNRPGGSADVAGTSDWTITKIVYDGVKPEPNPAPLSAQCGPAHGRAAFEAPSGSSLCLSGEGSEVSGNNPYIWTCTGSYNFVNCASACRTVNGACGINPGTCTSGTSENLHDENRFSTGPICAPPNFTDCRRRMSRFSDWNCTGICGGITESCSKFISPL